MSLDKYYQALERLKARGAKINNDTVAIEAGSQKGSIKNSRPQHAQLISDIKAASVVVREAKVSADPVPKLEDDKRRLQRLLDESREREISLLDEVMVLKAQIAAITSGKVTTLAGVQLGPSRQKKKP